MDDISFQKWTDALAVLRRTRTDALNAEQQNPTGSFGPEAFFNLASESLDHILDQWFTFEQQAWDANPPANETAEAETIRAEMESIVDFEVEAVREDLSRIRSNSVWEDGDVAPPASQFDAYVGELRKKYLIKMNSLGATGKRKAAEPVPRGKVQIHYSGSGGSSGVGIFTMFLLGMLLGGAPAVYFWDNAKKSEKRYEEDRAKLLADQRALQDNVALLQENFNDLATMKVQQLDRALRQIHSEIEEEKSNVENDYARNREHLMKKISAGNRLDQALQKIDKDRENRLAYLSTQETARTEPLKKQRDVLKGLLGR